MELELSSVLSSVFSRTLLYRKIESIVYAMLDPVTGVPLRKYKQLLTTVPSAFTGEDLIDWLMAKLSITEL
ncbi:hypothetical protein GJ496_009284, partial [Pomphorhynchus laevis]